MLIVQTFYVQILFMYALSFTIIIIWLYYE